MQRIEDNDILAAKEKLSQIRAELAAQDEQIKKRKKDAPGEFLHGRGPAELAAEISSMIAIRNILKDAVDLAEAEVKRLEKEKPLYEKELAEAQAAVNELEAAQYQNISAFMQSLYATWQAALTAAETQAKASRAADEYRNQISRRSTVYGDGYFRETENQLAYLESTQSFYFEAAKIPNRSERVKMARACGVFI